MHLCLVLLLYCCCQTGDILCERHERSVDSVLRRQYSVLVDKGTYDAISLNPDDPTWQRARYVDSVLRLMRDDALFVLTSCNWTQAELEQHFRDGTSGVGHVMTRLKMCPYHIKCRLVALHRILFEVGLLHESVWLEFVFCEGRDTLLASLGVETECRVNAAIAAAAAAAGGNVLTATK